MAFRGRGRGGRFGGGDRGATGYAKQEPFILFPEIELPPARDVTDEEKALLSRSSKLQKYWKNSLYFLEAANSGVGKSNDIEKFSDREEKLKTKAYGGSFMQYLEAYSSNFPKELVSGEERRRKRQKVQWNTDPDLQKLDVFEKLEQKYQSQEEKDGKEKKEGEEEEEEEEAVEEEDEEFSDDGDYNQNVDFDDDEDDFNMADDNNDEGIY